MQGTIEYATVESNTDLISFEVQKVAQNGWELIACQPIDYSNTAYTLYLKRHVPIVLGNRVYNT